MNIMRLAFGFAALPFIAGVALAGAPLSDEQMDRVTAGDVATLTPIPTVSLPSVQCTGCVLASGNTGTLTYSGGFVDFLQAYVQHLITKGYPQNP